MKETTRVIDVKESIWSENEARSEKLRSSLDARGVLMVDLMGSPGSGKTSLLLETLERLPAGIRAAVIEGDLESTTDADKVNAAGWDAVQIRTGGYCHLDAAMVASALESLGFGPAGIGDGEAPYDIVFVENIGNLVCTAQSDVGARLRVAHLSRPEGDDKPVKYPIMFRSSDAVVLTKSDYGDIAPFDTVAVMERIRFLNPRAAVFETSCRTGLGLDEWALYLAGKLKDLKESQR